MSWIITGTQKNNWTPADIDAALWLDASDASTITESGGAVSQWDDKSGNNKNLTQATVLTRPTTNSRTINGLNALEFNASNGLFTTSTVLSGNPGLLIASIVLFDAVVGTIDRVCQISAGSASFALTGGSVYSIRYNSGNQQFSPPATSVPLILLGTYPSGGTYADAKLFVNGSVLTPSSVGNPTGVLNLGAGFVVGGGTNTSTIGTISEFMDGLIGEVVCTTANDQVSRQRIEGYLAHKWGLTANLPANHPYKTAVPVP